MCGSVCLKVWHTSGDWSHVTPCFKLLIVKVQHQGYATHYVCVFYFAFSVPLSVLPIFSLLPPLMFETTSIISSSVSEYIWRHADNSFSVYQSFHLPIFALLLQISICWFPVQHRILFPGHLSAISLLPSVDLFFPRTSYFSLALSLTWLRRVMTLDSTLTHSIYFI